MLREKSAKRISAVTATLALIIALTACQGLGNPSEGHYNSPAGDPNASASSGNRGDFEPDRAALVRALQMRAIFGASLSYDQARQRWVAKFRRHGCTVLAEQIEGGYRVFKIGNREGITPTELGVDSLDNLTAGTFTDKLNEPLDYGNGMPEPRKSQFGC